MANRNTDKATITRSEYLQLLGLMELARRTDQHLQSIVKAASEIVGEKPDSLGGPFPYSGHAADECHSGDPSADALLSRLEITVEEA